ncbi:MAG: MBL fold metallo-hydrolase [Staphylococcus equorum]|uniref:MBL fold metallo-hydrolase n=1 Tax=Staphylococcus TaxID=1279 RepID=UPI000623F427|nr:MBL fold metallo-hydrolase [Staphylococcus equorum]KKI53114.1 hypothetical protein UF72_1975 [Staphylococcus equorum subsp. equorum]MDG0836403.1 MBL fold metallo-hydrolase [Staphylococcus equorum]MDK9872285.1 MBL fold metallo-hydrolase [Staphylococcus equorum]MDK9878044.1 MBL fold metallo-hydrolase [Staphylococcus equorum]MDN5808539.1 MBL fold metallo-hydrolase [Staphylococcus equorum]
MNIEFLGTAGGIPTLYNSVSQHKESSLRTGPGIYIHDIQLLIDTSEDIFTQLRRAQISEIKHALYSHWHPDHTMGLRIWETLNYDFKNKKPNSRKTKIYITQQEVADFKTYLGHWNHLNYLTQIDVIELEVVENDALLTIDDIQIEWIQLPESIAFGFYINAIEQSILIIPDEMKGFVPSQKFKNIDVAILPFGSNEVNPITGERLLENGVLKESNELSFDESVEIAREINATHTYFTHIESTEGLTMDDTKVLEQRLLHSGLSCTIAYDGLKIQT